MFGSNRAHNAHPDGTTITTTTHTTKTTTPHYPSRTSGIMNRLRPRNKVHNDTTTYNTSRTTAGRQHNFLHRNKNNNHLHTGSTAPARQSRMSRRKNRSVPVAATTTTTTPMASRRKSSMGDKVSGAMTKLRGNLTGQPAVEAAGTRRMHGADGRGAVKYY